MAVTSNRSVLISMTGGVEYSQTFDAAVSSLGSGQITLNNLSSGDNVIDVPADCVGVTIIPPTNNTQYILLQGNVGDTGVSLSMTDPTSLGLDGSGDPFVLHTGGAITGVRLVFS